MTTPAHQQSPNVHTLPGLIQGVAEQPQAPAAVGPTVEEQAHEMQALSEGVVLDDRVECLGGHYRIADKVGLMPLMKFAHNASKGVDSDDFEGLAAIYDMLRDCIHEDDWTRFERDMTAKKAEADDMMPVVTKTIEILNARPTQPRSDSSSGPERTSAMSKGASSSPGRVPPGLEELTPVDQLASLG